MDGFGVNQALSRKDLWCSAIPVSAILPLVILDFMSIHLDDWKRTALAALGLTGLAAVVAFGIHPGGFEGQGAWLLFLLPATLAAYPAADYVHRVAPNAEPIVFGTLVGSLNFLWYWGITYAVIRIRRALV